MGAYQKEYYDLLQAYALGCLDEAELLKLRSYIQSGENYAFQELGEFQNLAALLPSILKPEIPDQQLKDSIARKLYRIRDEIRTKRTADISSFKTVTPPAEPSETKSEPVQGFILAPESTTVDETPLEHIPEAPPVTPLVETVKQTEPVHAYHIKDFEEVTPFRKTTEQTPLTEEVKKTEEQDVKQEVSNHEMEIESDDFYNEADEIKFNKIKMPSPAPIVQPVSKGYEDVEPEPEEKKRSFLIPALFIFIIILIAAAVYAYFQIYSEVKTYKTEVTRLTEEISNLGTQANSDTQDLQLLMEEPETKVINLFKANNVSGFGRVIINLEQRRGYLQLGKLPELTAERRYQLWFNASGKFTSLGLFNSTGSVEYHKLLVPAVENKNRIAFILTEEPLEGSANPGKEVILSGQL